MCLFLIKNIYLSIIYIPQYKLVLIFILIKYTVFYWKNIFLWFGLYYRTKINTIKISRLSWDKA